MFYCIFRRMYFYELIDLDDSWLESWRNHDVLCEFVWGDSVCCSLRGAAFGGENCGFCILY